MESGQDLVTYTIPVSPGWVNSIAFVPGGLRLTSMDGVREITIWDVMTGQEIYRLPVADASVKYNQGGTQIATGNVDGIVQVWDGLTGQELFSLAGHNLPVFEVTFSPDGKWLASGGMDSIIKVWDLETREQLFSLPGHTSSIFSLEFSPDGKLLVSGSFDGATKVWGVSANSPMAGQELHHFSGTMQPINFIFLVPMASVWGRAVISIKWCGCTRWIQRSLSA